MTKIAYNACYGGFGLSKKAEKLYAKKLGIPVKDIPYRWETNRADPLLIEVIEELGKKASSYYAALEIRDLPKGTKYIIHEYDGNEWVKTIDEFDWKTA